MRFQVLCDSPDFVAIDKPAGFAVHALPGGLRMPRSKIILQNLRRQLQQELFPVHRLDIATSGVLVFAKSSSAASQFQGALPTAKKTYWAVVRGRIDNPLEIDLPLESESGEAKPSLTRVTPLKHLRWAGSPRPGFDFQDYTWIAAQPMTGRFHQIRRHLRRSGHPVIGDNDHGDSHQNRFVREQWQVSGLLLRAVELEIRLPGGPLQVQVSPSEHPANWLKVLEIFKGARQNFCQQQISDGLE